MKTKTKNHYNLPQTKEYGKKPQQQQSLPPTVAVEDVASRLVRNGLVQKSFAAVARVAGIAETLALNSFRLRQTKNAEHDGIHKETYGYKKDKTNLPTHQQGREKNRNRNRKKGKRKKIPIPQVAVVPESEIAQSAN
jgi:hypothetical protein